MSSLAESLKVSRMRILREMRTTSSSLDCVAIIMTSYTMFDFSSSRLKSFSLRSVNF